MRAACSLGGQVDFYAELGAEQVLGRNRGRWAEQLDAVFEQAGDVLTALERSELQWFARRGVDGEGALGHASDFRRCGMCPQ